MAESIKSLIDAALRKLGLLGTGEQAEPSEYAEALSCLRMMLDTWSTESLLVPFTITEEFDLTAGQAHYAMGPGGDWHTARPEAIEVVRILEADGRSYNVPESSQHRLSHQSTVDAGRPRAYVTTADTLFRYVEFNSYPTGKALITSRKPLNVVALDNFDAAYVDGLEPQVAYPGNLTLTGIQTPLTFPSGYWSALVHNLAVWMAPEYPGATVSPVVAGIAGESKALIRRQNAKPVFIRTDPVLMRGACR